MYSVGRVLGEREKTALRLVPEQDWQIAIDAPGKVWERGANDAYPDARCAHRACWIEEAHVAELTGAAGLESAEPEGQNGARRR